LSLGGWHNSFGEPLLTKKLAKKTASVSVVVVVVVGGVTYVETWTVYLLAKQTCCGTDYAPLQASSSVS